MNNTEVIKKLKECVTKLESDINTLEIKRDNIPSSDDESMRKQDELTSLMSEMIAKKSALESVINERETAEAGSIPPLSPDLVTKFEEQMNQLNVVIQADQNFDKIVAVAKGINSAAAEMKTTTNAELNAPAELRLAFKTLHIGET
ncbi:MAG: hypothetical protein Q8K07_19920 [Methylicorpusculum sp.]|uniref:hypothetical protein n=1 Tax=Pseudomonadota TaxID=1224 RepID=UPI00271CA6C6|nr:MULTISPECIES: hypothetical protein [Pseudomonadota]MDO9149983.1 hypothetical protein [Methylotenera sp.]MDP2204290.1 hypothetical protein [Methylicorpusculum sp.]